MKNKREKTRKFEFSKRLFIFISALNVLLLLFCCVVTWKTGDLQILTVAIVGTAADQAFAIKYYYRKAEQENKIKLMQKHGITPEREDFTNNSGGEF